jgi:Arc/MetJ-type ribon-helix-helix transcriptional regulator
MVEMSLENQRFIDEIVADGRFKNRDDAIDQAIWLLRSEVRQQAQEPADALTAEEWCERFETWAASHRQLPHEADDSRESIYAGRDE